MYTRASAAARLIIEEIWKPLQYSRVAKYLNPGQLVSEMEYYAPGKREGIRSTPNNVARSLKPIAEWGIQLM